MHAMGGVIDMRRFRGLRHRMPITCWTFAVGGLALSGIPPFAGFFSKDEILAALKSASHASQAAGLGGRLPGDLLGRGPDGLPDGLLHRPGLLHDLLRPGEAAQPRRPRGPGGGPGAACRTPTPATATTSGHGHGGHDAHLGHESPPVMTIPLIILAVCAVLVGLDLRPRRRRAGSSTTSRQTLGFEPLGHFRTRTASTGRPRSSARWSGVLGLALSYVMYAQPSPIPARLARQAPAALPGVVPQVLRRRALRLGRSSGRSGPWPPFCDFLDDVPGARPGARRSPGSPGCFGRELLAPFQNGLIQFYAAVTALGVAGLLWILVLMK